MFEGFRATAICNELDARSIPFDEGEKEKGQSLALLERLLDREGLQVSAAKLPRMREVQRIRSTLKAHYGGSGAKEIPLDALEEYGSYRDHFQAVCRGVVAELNLITQVLS